MSPVACTRDARARVAGRARRAVALGFALFVAGLTPAPTGVARADDPEALRTAFLEAPRASWPARMDAIGRSAEQVGAVIGPVLRDREPGHLGAVAYAAAWLADHPAAGRVLLDEEIVRRGGSDPAFARELRLALAPDGAGWGRLVAVARGLALGPMTDAPLATLAASFLRHELTASNVRDLLDLWDRAGESAVGATAKESLEQILRASFASPEAAKRFLDADQGKTLLDWIRDLSRAKDLPDAPMFRRLLAEAATNLARVTTPDGLRPYLVPETTPWPEVRRLAAARAKAIDSGAAGWTALFVESVDRETDVETLDALLRSFDRIKSFEQGSTARLAEGAARRLRASAPPADGLSIGLLAVLGRLGTSELLRGTFATLVERRASAAVLSAWLDAAAAVKGLSAEIRDLYQSRRAKSDPEAAQLRIRALGALARGGAETPGETSANASFLAAILAERAQDTAADVLPSIEERSAAARGLEAFPVPVSVAALADHAIDASEDPALARLAASVLGRLAAQPGPDGGVEALDALIVVARDAGVIGARISAIDDLGRLVADVGDRSAPAMEVFRRALDPAGPFELRRAAARASAAAADVLALPGVFALVADETVATAGPPAGTDSALQAAERLVRALASLDGSPDRDLALARACRTLLDSGPAGAALALELAKAAADAGGGRAALQETRARLYLRRARSPGRTADERISDLDEGHRVLDALLRSGADGNSRLPPTVAALERELVIEGLQRRVAQLGGDAAAPASDEISLARHRKLAELIAAATAHGVVSASVGNASEADANLLAKLRESKVRDVRFAALVDSARGALRAPRSPAFAERVRMFLATARTLEPTEAETAELEALEAEVSGERAPPTPK